MADKKISELPNATAPLAGSEVLAVVQSGTTDKVTVENLTAGRTVNVSTLIAGTDPSGLGRLRIGGDAWIAGNLKMPDGAYDIGDSGATGRPRDVYASRTIIIGSDPSGLGSLRVGGAAWLSGYLKFAADAQHDIGEAANGRPRDIYLAGNIIPASGKGIDFSADGSAAGMTSELLDDYEEGTWTPTFGRGSSDPTVTYTNQVGVYTKIGRQVIAVFDITASSISGGSGDAIIKGLPFPKGNLPSATFQYRAADAVPAGSAGQVLGSYSNSGDTILYLQYENTGTAGYGTAGPVTSWNASGRINGWITYFV